jgi:hypothetical protein
MAVKEKQTPPPGWGDQDSEAAHMDFLQDEDEILDALDKELGKPGEEEKVLVAHLDDTNDNADWLKSSRKKLKQK